MHNETLKEVHHHVHVHLPTGLWPFLNALLKVFKMDMQQLEAALTGVSDSLGTVGTDLVGSSDKLTKALNEIIIALANQGGTTPAVDAAVAKLQAVATALAGQATSVQTVATTLDDLNADLPTP